MARDMYSGQAFDLGPLFSGLRQPSRNSDPETSHTAARELVASGQLTEQCAETLVALVRWQWSRRQAPTSCELADGSTVLRYRYARRLPELKAAELVTQLTSKRTCAVTGRASFPWEVTEKGQQTFRRIRAERKEGS